LIFSAIKFGEGFTAPRQDGESEREREREIERERPAVDYTPIGSIQLPSRETEPGAARGEAFFFLFFSLFFPAGRALPFSAFSRHD
jgi:hypothetical protein